MAKHIAALFVILMGATVAWEILYGTLYVRTSQADTDQRAEIQSLWGSDHKQSAPTFAYASLGSARIVPLNSSTIAVDLALEERRKGLLYFNAYHVAYSGTYSVTDYGNAQRLTFTLPLPASDAVYDDVGVFADGRPVATTIADGAIVASIPANHGLATTVLVSYRSQGSGKWSYDFACGLSAVRNFDLVMRTNFDAIDFPSTTLAPTSERHLPSGWQLEWRYSRLVAGHGIGMVFPEPLQPGPLAQRITFWAPLSLLFYFFVLFVITTLRRIDLHPMNYYFLAASFFAFHLLFAYTVDRLTIGEAFALCSTVSMGMTISYLRLVVGLRFAALEAGLAQLFYLVLFSLALFNEGFSGLAVTVGAIVTLYLTMMLTARVVWRERFKSKPAAAS